MNYKPARCDARLPAKYEHFHVIQEKLDGCRYLLYIGEDPTGRTVGTSLMSRSIGQDGFPINKAANIPFITNRISLDKYKGTIIDIEIFKDDFPTTMSIIGSSPEVAITKQENGGRLTAYAFDILAINGDDIRGLPLNERLNILLDVISDIDIEELKFLQYEFTDNVDLRFKEVTDRGGEGLIVKDLRKPYGVGWAKLKKSYDVTGIITGFTEGKNKYEGQIGAIKVSVYSDGELLEIAFASGFYDEVRLDMSINPSRYLGQAVDLFAQEISKDLRLRHPTFNRMRPDVNKEECTLERVKEAFKNAKSDRRK